MLSICALTQTHTLAFLTLFIARIIDRLIDERYLDIYLAAILRFGTLVGVSIGSLNDLLRNERDLG